MQPGLPPSDPATAPTLAAVLDRLRSYCRARGWSPGQLASEAGLSRGTLSRLFEQDWLPSGSTISAIERLIPAHWQPGDPVPATEAASVGAEAASAAGGE